MSAPPSHPPLLRRPVPAPYFHSLFLIFQLRKGPNYEKSHFTLVTDSKYLTMTQTPYFISETLKMSGYSTWVLVSCRTAACRETYYSRQLFLYGVSLLFSPDAQFVLCGSYDGGLYVWNTKTHGLEKLMKEHK